MLFSIENMMFSIENIVFSIENIVDQSKLTYKKNEKLWTIDGWNSYIITVLLILQSTAVLLTRL